MINYVQTNVLDMLEYVGEDKGKKDAILNDCIFFFIKDIVRKV